MDTGLENKHIFLTGASGGIGLITAKLLLEEGAKVSLHYNSNIAPLNPLLEQFEGQVSAIRADLTDEKQVIQAISASIGALGPIDGLVLNHGIWIAPPAPIHEMSLEQWNKTISTNLTGSFLTAREFLKSIIDNAIKDPSIVLISSTAGIFGEAEHSDYASSKSALMYGFMRSLKNEIVEYAPLGRVNTVAPGWVHTPMAEESLKDKELVTKVLQTIPLRKIATSEDIANAITFLLSNKLAHHISGEIIEVTGGMEGRRLFSAQEVNTLNNM